MKSVTSIVERIIEENPLMEYSMKTGIASHVKIAKYIHNDVEKAKGQEVNLSAIVMALQRFSFSKKEQKIKDFSIRNITTRSNLSEISIAKTPKIRDIISAVYNIIDSDRGEIVNFVHGNSETTIIFESQKMDKIKEKLKGEKILAEIVGLSEVSVLFSKNMFEEPGFLAHILKELAWREINVVEVISTYNELCIIVRDEEQIDAYKAIKNLFSPLTASKAKHQSKK
ncbi:hypothetical protein KO465_05585 [Candidatus Micrarchaeota archaeon]|nr:hypothetical protein [Candidatus Micrarchaeota archaeon]